MAKYCEVEIGALNQALCKADFGGTLCAPVGSDEYITEAHEITNAVMLGLDFEYAVISVFRRAFDIDLELDYVKKFCENYYDPEEEELVIDETPLTNFDRFLFDNKMTIEQLNAAARFIQEVNYTIV